MNWADPSTVGAVRVLKGALILAMAASAGGCHARGARITGAAGIPAIAGVAWFSGQRQVQATVPDVAVAATISLIDPTTSQTIATTLTDASGSFSLQLPGFSPQTQVYDLEAVKGLASNQAGNDAARLRTLVEWTGSSWLSVASGSASLSLGTTALSAIVALRQPYTPVNATLLMNTLTIGNPDTFDSTGTGVSNTEFTTVYGLVDQILSNNGDPLHYLTYDGSTYSSTLTPTAPFIETVQPDPAWPGSVITLYGRNFDVGLANNVLVLNAATLSLSSGDTTQLVATLPASASTGTLYLTTPAGSASTPLTVIPSVSGSTNATGSLPAAGSATTISGSLFGVQDLPGVPGPLPRTRPSRSRHQRRPL